MQILRTLLQAGGSGIMLLYSRKDRPDEQACSERRLPMRIVTGLLIVAVVVVVAVGGLVLVQRLVSTERRKQHNDVAGFIYAVSTQYLASPTPCCWGSCLSL